MKQVPATGTPVHVFKQQQYGWMPMHNAVQGEVDGILMWASALAELVLDGLGWTVDQTKTTPVRV